MYKSNLLILYIILALGVIFAVFYKGSKKTVDVLVKEKTATTKIVSSGEGNISSSILYLIYTNQGTYKCTDDLINWRFNSSDMYSLIETGKKYTITTYGWRIPFLSLYPNIINIVSHDLTPLENVQYMFEP